MLRDRTLVDSKRDPSVEGELLGSTENVPASDSCFMLRICRDWPLCVLRRSGSAGPALLDGDGRDPNPIPSGSSSSIMGSRGLTSSSSNFPEESLPWDGGRVPRDLPPERAPFWGAAGDGYTQSRLPFRQRSQMGRPSSHLIRRARQVKQPLRVRLCFFASGMGWSSVGCLDGYDDAERPMAGGAREESCQKATLSGYWEGPNREYADMLESCCIESRKPARAAWGW